MKRSTELFRLTFGICLAVWGIWWERIAIASDRWPTVEGTVVQSRLARGNRNWSADVRYEYTVSGLSYQNDRVSLAVWKNDSVQLTQYPVGTRVAVHYAPSDPGTSILEPGGYRGLVLIAAGIIFVVDGVRRRRAS